MTDYENAWRQIGFGEHPQTLIRPFVSPILHGKCEALLMGNCRHAGSSQLLQMRSAIGAGMRDTAS
jgi:hypothetical protein